MKFESKAQPVCCTGHRRIAKHVIWQSIALAAAALTGFCPPVVAQTATLTNGGIAAGAISCAPSDNNTGHTVCLEYSTSGSLTGVSWQAPHGGNGGETVDTVDQESLGTPDGAPVGAPGCGPENNGAKGIAACLVVSKTTSNVIIQEIAFYPPTDNAHLTTPSGFVTLAKEPADAVIGNPSCVSANAGGPVVCAIAINGKLFGVGFEPMAQFATALTPLLGDASITGNPSCASVEIRVRTPLVPPVCAVREGNSLVGFALTFSPTAGVAAANVITLGSMIFAGDPSCTIPEDGVLPNDDVGLVLSTSFVTTCGIVSGTTLFGVSFDPIDPIPGSSPSSHTTAFQPLGKAPDTGSWTGLLGCSSIVDFRAEFPNASPNQNLIGCAAISSTGNVFEQSFDPRLSVARSVVGPFAGHVNGNLSCLSLFVDPDYIFCGGTTTAGASGGYTIPVGILPAGVASVLGKFLSD